MSENTVNQEICKKCKFCIDVCPVKMIGVDSEGLVNFIPERESICIECGQCMAVCPTDAIKISKYNYETDLFKRPIQEVDYELFMKMVQSRRSIRNFKDKPVEREVLEQILASLQYAPYGAEPNKVEVTIVNNRQIIEKCLPPIAKFMDDIVKWIENPFMSFIIKQKLPPELFNTIKNHLYPMAKLENYKLETGDRITRNAPAMMIFHAEKGAEEHTNNALIYSTFAMFTAHSLGVGTLYNGIVPAGINKLSEVKQLFNIPENHEAVISLMIGYPKYKYKKTVKRPAKKANWIE